MDNDSLYLEIWRGQWSKKTDGRAAFAALIEPFGKSEPRTTLSQKLTDEAFVLEVRDGAKVQAFEWRLKDNSFSYTGPDGRKSDIK